MLASEMFLPTPSLLQNARELSLSEYPEEIAQNEFPFIKQQPMTHVSSCLSIPLLVIKGNLMQHVFLLPFSQSDSEKNQRMETCQAAPLL